MSQAALSVATPGVIYGRLDLSPGRVTSFNQLVEDGRISYDNRYEKSKITASLVADFGPLLGVPCAVAISGTPNNPYDQYRFAGVSVGACNSVDDNNLNVRTASDIDPNARNVHSECISCQLNFESVVSSLTSASSQVGPTFFLFRAVFRLYKGLKDPDNIPRSWETNPNYVSETYRRFGGVIPKKCVKSLRKGKRCLANSCEIKVAKKVTDSLRGTIEEISVPRFGYATVKLSTCNKKIKVNVNRSQDGSSCGLSKVKVPSSCSSIRKDK